VVVVNKYPLFLMTMRTPVTEIIDIVMKLEMVLLCKKQVIGKVRNCISISINYLLINQLYLIAEMAVYFGLEFCLEDSIF